MAYPAIADARAHLTTLPNVTILDGFDPREPDCLAVVFCGIRYYEVRRLDGCHLAAHTCATASGCRWPSARRSTAPTPRSRPMSSRSATCRRGTRRRW